MDGVHDMGGMHGFGGIDPEQDEPVFHAEWEKRAFALNLTMGFHGGWNIDRSRSFRESLPPATYLAASYYEIWLRGLERLIVDAGFVDAGELDSGKPAHGHDKPNLRSLAASSVAKVLSTGTPARRAEGLAGRFEVGDQIRVRNFHPAGHTRAPRYCRGKLGVVHIDHGLQVFPDSNAKQAGEDPRQCYSVKFSLRELWGEEAAAADYCFIDLWDPYLEPA